MILRRLAPRIALLGFAWLAACSSSNGEHEHVDEGRACVGGEQFPDNLVTIMFGCLSSSCDTLVESSCTATLEGTTLTVESRAVVRTKGHACTDDCGEERIACDMPPLAAGTYTLRFGDDSVELTVPATVETCTEGL